MNYDTLPCLKATSFFISGSQCSQVLYYLKSVYSMYFRHRAQSPLS